MFITARRRGVRASRSFDLRPLAYALACAGAVSAQAQVPGGFSPRQGGVDTPVTVGNANGGQSMAIRQTTPRAVVDWSSFSIGAKDRVDINQTQGAQSVMLNRVVGNGPASQIAGTLTANGHVYLVNPAGVTFAKGSTVNVGGLVASTLQLVDDASFSGFMSGTSKQLVFELPADKSGVVLNQGSITAAEGGIVALVGAQARNEGEIQAVGGSIGLAAGRQVTLDFEGDGLTTFRVDTAGLAGTLSENAANATLSADGGRIVMVAASDVAETVVNQAGTLRARSLQSRNGEILLSSQEGTPGIVAVGGTLDASGASGGGAIRVEGGQVHVGDAEVDASGGSGANGSWTIHSSAAPLAVLAAGAEPVADSSTVDAGALGRALSRGTDATLSTSQGSGEGVWPPVSFEPGAEVVKTGGPTSTLTALSGNSVLMAPYSVIRSENGALNVHFSANSQAPSLDEQPLSFDAPRNSVIDLEGAGIFTGGGDIRFYGQGDAENGRALGILVQQSALSTCAVPGGACGGSGVIDMRSQGETIRPTETFAVSEAGISILGSTLETGAGAISLDGIGGTGSAGVAVSSYQVSEGPLLASSLQSRSGNISLAGSSRGWFEGDGNVVFFGNPDGTGSQTGAGSGVVIGDAAIATAGNVSVVGRAGDLDDLYASAAFLDRASGLNDGAGALFSAGQGVAIASSSVVAGAGKEIAITGTAGSGSLDLRDAGALLAAAPALAEEDTVGSFGVDIQGAPGKALQTAGGRIAIDGGAGDVSIRGSGPVVDGAPQRLDLVLDAANPAGKGGTISVTGRNVAVGREAPAAIDASGADGGGTIDLSASAAQDAPASGIVAVGAGSVLRANATGNGNGGSIRAIGEQGLRSYGRFEVRGGAVGGNGGSVETSAPSFDLAGTRVDASAPAGTAGSWLIDPYDVTIVHGADTGSLDTNPFVPLADATIQDGDINAALNGGTNVRITTGAAGDGDPFLGDIFLDDAQILYDTAGGARTLQLDAHRSVRSNAGTSIVSAGLGGPLNVIFNADANNSGPEVGGGQVSYSGTLYTNGGDVTMNGAWSAPNTAGNGDCSICLDGTVIDTRAGNSQVLVGTDLVNTGGSDAGPGGAVRLTGRGTGPSSAAVDNFAAVLIAGTAISTSTGDVEILGTSLNQAGVALQGAQGLGGIFTTSGKVAVTGIGSLAASGADQPGQGLVIDGATLRTLSGDIAVHGLRQAGAGDAGAGVLLRNGALLTTTGGGNIDVTGQSEGNGAGVVISGAIPPGPFGGPTQAAARIDGSNHVVLRASNDGSTDALVIGGTVRAANVLGLRPGGLDAAGPPENQAASVADRTALPITLGGTAAAGFAVSADEFTRLAAGTVVVGSDAHAGDIDVVGPLALSSPLTLQNGGGGNIALGAPVSTPQLGLLSAGDITQAAGAAVSAGLLLARSTGGSVLLADAANDVGTVGGGAAGRFAYADANALTLGNVAVTGFDAAANLPQPQSATSMAAAEVLVRTLSGDLSLGTSVSSSAGADLVAAARFQNLDAYTIAGAPWRVWADTWVGEARGGLSGSGPLPNLYHCAYLGLCSVSVPAGGNHFVYAQQPAATVTIADATRPGGAPNPTFTYSVTGLILGDTGAGFAGSPSSAATAASPAGAYPITGSFTSAEGYAVNVVPGTLTVAGFTQLPKADVVRELPTTWLYDRNIGPPPMCFATGPLQGDGARQGDDVLAREWSRVRSRPNLTNCVDTQRRNGCADF
jgi:filamentous hemagglutinin family protein